MFGLQQQKLFALCLHNWISLRQGYKIKNLFNCILSIWLSTTRQHNCRHCHQFRSQESKSQETRDILEGYLWCIKMWGNYCKLENFRHSPVLAPVKGDGEGWGWETVRMQCSTGKVLCLHLCQTKLSWLDFCVPIFQFCSVHLSIRVPIPCCLGYCSIIISLEVK